MLQVEMVLLPLFDFFWCLICEGNFVLGVLQVLFRNLLTGADIL